MKVFVLLDNSNDIDAENYNERIIRVCSTYEGAKNAIYEQLMDNGFAKRDEIIHDEKTGRFMYDDGSGYYYIVEKELDEKQSQGRYPWGK